MLIKFEPYQAKNILQKIEEKDNYYRSGYTLNPYRGCAVGCRYCNVQQKKYKDSSGFEDEKDHVVQVKINAPHMLRKKLSANIDPGMIVLGESCEPFSDIEDEYFITQRLLEILRDYRFPLHIITRFPRVLRDIEILKQINEKCYVCVTVSIPVISRKLVLRLEGNSPAVKERLQIVKTLRKYDIAAGIAVMPVIPYISDGEEVNSVLRKASEVDASYVFFGPLVIKSYQREMFFGWLNKKYPKLVEPYEKLYETGEMPRQDYWINFYKYAKKTASDFELDVGLPVNNDTFDQQELFRFGCYE